MAQTNPLSSISRCLDNLTLARAADGPPCKFFWMLALAESPGHPPKGAFRENPSECRHNTMNQIPPDSTPLLRPTQGSHSRNLERDRRSRDSQLRPYADNIYTYDHELAATNKALLLHVTPQIAGLNLHGVAADNTIPMPPRLRLWRMSELEVFL